MCRCVIIIMLFTGIYIDWFIEDMSVAIAIEKDSDGYNGP